MSVNTRELHPLKKLLSMEVDGTYYCNYPKDPEVDNIVTSSETRFVKPELCKDGIRSYYCIPRHGDVISKMVIKNPHGKIDFKLNINSRTKFKCSYEKTEGVDLVVKPFDFGIPLMTFHYSQVDVYITGNNDGLDIIYLHLGTEDRQYIARNEYTIRDFKFTPFGLLKKINGNYKNYDLESDVNPEELVNKMIKDVNYFCDYPENPDVDNIRAVENSLEKEDTGEFYYKKKGDTQGGPSGTMYPEEYTVARKGDILKSFTVYGIKYGIYIKVEIGGYCYYDMKYEKYTGDLLVKPFIFGIPLSSLRYHEVRISINGEHSGLRGTFITLCEEDREKLTGSNNIVYPGGFVTSHGMFFQHRSHVGKPVITPYETTENDENKNDKVTVTPEAKKKGWLW